MRNLAETRLGLGLASFLESTVVPIPLELLVAPLMVMHPQRAWRIAAVIWVGCILGALLLFTMAWFAYEPLVLPLLETIGVNADLEDIEKRFDNGGVFWTIMAISVLPIPFQIGALGAGALHVNLLTFLLAVMISRAIRYFGLAALASWLGPRVMTLLVDERAKRIILVATLLVVGFLAWQLLGD